MSKRELLGWIVGAGLLLLLLGPRLAAAPPPPHPSTPAEMQWRAFGGQTGLPSPVRLPVPPPSPTFAFAP